MCGILGTVGEKIPKERFESALATLRHRGPDDQGVFVDEENTTFLGHQRLSIIDLSPSGRNPFWSADKRYVIIFNGEIYNYLEIKDEIGSRYSFQTKTDTEVLLASFVLWGSDCLSRLNGMFAFAIWDTEKREIFCARDRVGEKPFFYSWENGVFAFASEIKALRALGYGSETNPKAIAHYLYYGFYDHTEETFFGGIRSLPAGSYARFSEGALSIDRYWDIANAKNAFQNDDDTVVREKFRELLSDSIKLRFRSDVPVGLNLSSGLDSNALRYFAEKVTDKPLHLFSMCATEPEYNECALIEPFLTASEKERWHRTVLSPEEVETEARTMNALQDQPYGGIPTLAYGKLCRLAKEQSVTVLLEGQGLDELLAGYKYYRIEFLRDLWREHKYPQLFEYLRRQKMGTFTGNLRRLLEVPKIRSQDYSQDTTKLIDQNVFAKNFKEFAQAHPLSFPAPFESHLLNAQYRDLFFAKMPRVLRFNDHATMGSSRELRQPYLDHRLIEFLFWLPPHHKISYNSQKVLARKTFMDVVPEVVRGKQKVTFGAWQTVWFRKYGKEWVMDTIRSEAFQSRGYWDSVALRQKAEDFFDGRGDNSFFLWQCINLDLWFKEYFQ